MTIDQHSYILGEIRGDVASIKDSVDEIKQSISAQNTRITRLERRHWMQLGATAAVVFLFSHLRELAPFLSSLLPRA